MIDIIDQRFVFSPGGPVQFGKWTLYLCPICDGRSVGFNAIRKDGEVVSADTIHDLMTLMIRKEIEIDEKGQ